MKLVETTVGNARDARRITDALLSSGAAKCVSSHKVESTYLWKGKKMREREIGLEAKCADGKLAKKAAALIEKMHPYEVPMILVLDAKAVNAKYAKWLEKTGKKK